MISLENQYNYMDARNGQKYQLFYSRIGSLKDAGSAGLTTWQ
jgi:hypothetical protein